MDGTYTNFKVSKSKAEAIRLQIPYKRNMLMALRVSPLENLHYLIPSCVTRSFVLHGLAAPPSAASFGGFEEDARIREMRTSINRAHIAPRRHRDNPDNGVITSVGLGALMCVWLCSRFMSGW
ncbi:hypothetical protein J6590_037865 [Homalodisca vitripennis]|nr:hypothetical protein J6590_037865 [Homalodisca vitripennis]